MRPLKLTISNFGPHRETVIDFAKLQSPFAIVAPAGTGKTFLMEAIYAALYGQFIWYDGSIYDAMTQGGDGESSLELWFSHGFHYYCASRKIKDTGKSKSQSANFCNLLLTESGSVSDGYARIGSQIAGPKVGDFDRAIEAMLGSKELARATWMLSQSRTGDLAGQPGEPNLVKRRMEVFHEMIGASELDAICARAGDAARKFSGAIDELEIQLAGLPDHDAEIMDAQAGKAAAESGLSAARERLAASEAELETARKALRDAQGGGEALQEQIDEHARAEAAEAVIKRRVDAATQEVLALKARAAGLSEAEAQVEALAGLRADLARLDDQQMAFSHWDRWERRRAELQAEISRLEGLAETIKATPGADDATVALAGRLDDLMQEHKDRSAENAKKIERNAGYAARRAECNKKISGFEWRIAETKKRIAAAPVPPFGEKCAPCQFMKDFSGLGNVLEAVGRELEVERKMLDGIEIDEKLFDIQDIIARGVEARAAANTVKFAEAATAKLKSLNHELMAIKLIMQGHLEEKPAVATDPSEEIRTARLDADKLAGAEDRAKACRQAAADYDERKKQCDSLCYDEHGPALERIIKSRLKAEAARAAMADRELLKSKLSGAESQSLQAMLCVQETIESHVAEIAALDQKIIGIESQKQESAERRDRHSQLIKKHEGMSDLRLALGPKGVRQILIDNVAPDLSAIADDLFDKTTDGRIRLRIATQKLNEDGVGIGEDFQILCTDERGERDILRYSGGELQFRLIAFRAAVVLWQKSMGGHFADCLLFDEAFDRCGDGGSDCSEELIKLLEYLTDKIAFIGVITHSSDIASRMRSQVRLAKTFSGVDVEIL